MTEGRLDGVAGHGSTGTGADAKGTGRDEEPGHDNWRADPPDPQPESTVGLAPGGSVQPGDTPPIESSTSATGYQQPDVPSGRTNWLVLGSIVLVVALSGILVLLLRFL
ncbi:MAG TPA: DUF6480 family protein [Kineosporiaceae bacterium]|jgi:hypothetical protein|nr:DUF6480 family protein [Kineosporiaceae bacterium]